MPTIKPWQGILVGKHISGIETSFHKFEIRYKVDYLIGGFGGGAGRLEVTSAKFEGLRLPARHRLVYDLMKEEMQREGGLHALQMKTRTEEEDRREVERSKE